MYGNVLVPTNNKKVILVNFIYYTLIFLWITSGVIKKKDYIVNLK